MRDTIRLPVNFSSRLQHATFQTSIHNRYPRVVSTMFLHPQHLNTSHIARQFRPSRRQISSGCAHPFDRVVRPGESVGPKIEKRQSSVCSLSLSLSRLVVRRFIFALFYFAIPRVFEFSLAGWLGTN